MKTLFSALPKICIALILIFFMSSCASTPQSIELGSIPLYDLEKQDIAQEKLESFLQGEWDGEPFALKIPKGLNLPVHITVDTPVANLDSDAGSLHFKRDVFIYLDKKRSLASPDGENWAPFSDMDLLKKLFDGDQGSLAISMSGTKNEGMLLSLSLLLTERQ